MLSPTQINYVVGDATNPVAPGNRIIAHCCNDAGYWNAGFVRALSARYHQPESAYRRWAQTNAPVPFTLGQVTFTKVMPGLCVANIIGQRGIRSNSNPRPIRYDALQRGLARVCQLALDNRASVHMPRLGAGLAGGDWSVIAEIINQELCGYGVNVTVYDLPDPKPRHLILELE
jgi:O-acetyl-ADP-ribose deacetylase (regulator of RNase III)